MATIHRVDRLEDVPKRTPAADFVVIDVIISSTSIVRLLEEGVAYVRPFFDIEEALAFKERTDDALLVGEQGGGPIDGFDLSPLPSVFRSHDLDGRPVGICTSNGTRAVERIGNDADVFVGTTVNAAAVAAELFSRERDTWLVPAGRRGEPAPEDTAGARLLDACYRSERDALDEIGADVDEIAQMIRSSGTAEWLRSLGFEHEIEAICSFNSTDVVPRLRDGVFVDGN